MVSWPTHQLHTAPYTTPKPMSRREVSIILGQGRLSWIHGPSSIGHTMRGKDESWIMFFLKRQCVLLKFSSSDMLIVGASFSLKALAVIGPNPRTWLVGRSILFLIYWGTFALGDLLKPKSQEKIPSRTYQGGSPPVKNSSSLSAKITCPIINLLLTTQSFRIALLTSSGSGSSPEALTHE